MSVDDYQKYLNKVLRFLSYRSRSEKEVLDYLQKKQTPYEIQSAIMDFLKERRFVNDEEFARGWIDQRLRSRPKSIRMLKLELKNKGISEDIATKAISSFQFSISNDLEQQGVNDLDTAKKLVSKKIERYRHLPKQELYQKLGGFLGRKGFDWETIKKAIDYVIARKNDEAI